MEMKHDKIIFVASHLLANLDLYADRVLFLKDGKFFHEQKYTDDNANFLKLEVSIAQYATIQAVLDLPAGYVYSQLPVMHSVRWDE